MTTENVLGSLLDCFDTGQRSLLGVCVERYVADLREACEEDQGTPDGRPGTVGHMMQAELAELGRILRTGEKTSTTVA